MQLPWPATALSVPGFMAQWQSSDSILSHWSLLTALEQRSCLRLAPLCRTHCCLCTERLQRAPAVLPGHLPGTLPTCWVL